MRRAGWLPFCSPQWGECTLAQLCCTTLDIYDSVGPCITLEATIRNIPWLMVKICSPIVQDPVPLNVAHQTRRCGFSSSTNSFMSRKQLTGFLYLCAIHIPQFTVPCHAMPSHAMPSWRSVFFPFCGTTGGGTVGTPMQMSCPAWGWLECWRGAIHGWTERSCPPLPDVPLKPTVLWTVSARSLDHHCLLSWCSRTCSSRSSVASVRLLPAMTLQWQPTQGSLQPVLMTTPDFPWTKLELSVPLWGALEALETFSPLLHDGTWRLLAWSLCCKKPNKDMYEKSFLSFKITCRLL